MTAAKSAQPSKKSYQDLEAELQSIINWFEGDNFDVDEAVVKYKRGLELVRELEKYLANAENTVKELKAKFSAKAK